MSVVLNGKEIAASMIENIKNQTEKLHEKPTLAIILVGHNEASRIYVRNKCSAAQKAGLQAKLLEFEENVSAQTLKEKIQSLNLDSHIHGIIIQLPLPTHLPTQELLATVDPLKDVDGFHPLNAGLLQNNNPNAFAPATARGVMALLKETGVELEGKNALVIGRSQIVGKPVAQLLLHKNCTVTIAHSKTQNLPVLVQNADIVVAACGQPKMIKGDMLKKGAIVIDVGINRDSEGKLCGDVDFETAKDVASFITPVPGGVGPMTVAMLLQNTLEAYLKQKNS